MNKYIDEFFKLGCYPEIQDAIMPIQNFGKEVTESMAIIKQLRKLTLKKKQYNYLIYDFCAGNALTSVIASFLFKNVSCYAIDKRPRDRKWHQVRNFNYVQSDIKKDNWIYKINEFKKYYPLTKTIIISVHPCRDLAERVISIHNRSENDYLILMPCCHGKTPGYSLPEVVVDKIGKYLMWSLYLQNKINGPSRLYIDKHCMSPKNCIIFGGL